MEYYLLLSDRLIFFVYKQTDTQKCCNGNRIFVMTHPGYVFSDIIYSCITAFLCVSFIK